MIVSDNTVKLFIHARIIQILPFQKLSKKFLSPHKKIERPSKASGFLLVPSFFHPVRPQNARPRLVVFSGNLGLFHPVRPRQSKAGGFLLVPRSLSPGKTTERPSKAGGFIWVPSFPSPCKTTERQSKTGDFLWVPRSLSPNKTKERMSNAGGFL